MSMCNASPVDNPPPS